MIVWRPLVVIVLCCCCAGCGDEQALAKVPVGAPLDPAAEQIIIGYFTAWNDKRFDDLAALFHPDARIRQFDGSAVQTDQGLDVFIAAQGRVRAGHPRDVAEWPTSIVGSMADDQATIVVRWQLRKPDAVSAGIDRFTLQQTAGAWRITNLDWSTE